MLAAGRDPDELKCKKRHARMNARGECPWEKKKAIVG
jgi:hypothetical protein